MKHHHERGEGGAAGYEQVSSEGQKDGRSYSVSLGKESRLQMTNGMGRLLRTTAIRTSSHTSRQTSRTRKHAWTQKRHWRPAPHERKVSETVQMREASTDVQSARRYDDPLPEHEPPPLFSPRHSSLHLPSIEPAFVDPYPAAWACTRTEYDTGQFTERIILQHMRRSRHHSLDARSTNRQCVLLHGPGPRNKTAPRIHPASYARQSHHQTHPCAASGHSQPKKATGENEK